VDLPFDDLHVDMVERPYGAERLAQSGYAKHAAVHNKLNEPAFDIAQVDLMQAFGRNQILFMPRTGGVVSAELATGNGTFPSIAPLPSNLPQKRDK